METKDALEARDPAQATPCDGIMASWNRNKPKKKYINTTTHNGSSITAVNATAGGQ